MRGLRAFVAHVIDNARRRWRERFDRRVLQGDALIVAIEGWL
jgi:hypothetical protein